MRVLGLLRAKQCEYRQQLGVGGESYDRTDYVTSKRRMQGLHAVTAPAS